MSKRIFLIDDEKPMTQLVGCLLALKGYALQSENDPEAGLNRLLGEDCDAVIVDLMMPRLDGLALIGKLRGSGRHQRTPIVALSAKTLTDAERKTLLDYNVRFVSKPISPTRLLAVVRETVGA